MAGEPDEAGTFFDSLQQDEVQAWSEPGDLSRMSIEGFTSRHVFGRPRSVGSLRLSGEGVVQHSADLDLVGAVCQEFQRLVGAVGAAREGVRTARGRLSDSLLNRTNLQLAASPMPGSVVLTVTPSADPNEESYPLGQGSLTEPPPPLIDVSMALIVQLLDLVATEGDPASAPLTDELNYLGPRAAGALRTLAKVLGESRVDVDLSWAEPSKPTKSVHVTAGRAEWLRRFVDDGRLDETRVEYNGVMRTVSDMRALDIQLESGEIISLRTDKDSPPLPYRLAVGDEVRVVASEKVEFKVGGGESRTYTVLALVLVEPNAPPE